MGFIRNSIKNSSNNSNGNSFTIIIFNFPGVPSTFFPGVLLRNSPDFFSAIFNKSLPGIHLKVPPVVLFANSSRSSLVILSSSSIGNCSMNFFEECDWEFLQNSTVNCSYNCKNYRENLLEEFQNALLMVFDFRILKEFPMKFLEEI